MAETPIGITFMPSADAAANGPRQAGVEGQGGSDLAQAFKILNLHLPRLLGAASIAPKRLLTSQGSAGVGAPGAPAGGFNPYSAVFESLLQSLSGSGPAGSGGGGYGGPDVASLASFFGGSTGGDASTTSGSPGGYQPSSSAPAPRIIPTGDPLPRSGEGGQLPVAQDPQTYTTSMGAPEPRDRGNRYL